MSIDPGIENRYAEILASTRARTAEIGERVEAVRQEIAAESQRMREQNERLCQELDERSAAREAAKNDPTAQNEWLKRTPKQGETFQFGESEELLAEQPAPPVPPAPPVSFEASPVPEVPAPAPPRRGRHSRPDEFDEDDFSSRNWLD
ncbi:hypothetical protein ORV05_30000 [Amycolatopsis cynarae]|uniref:Uncharacterized protein n=1 Tax=Amycolatopsis cynarae TaxID=2995223 RepID=A0ABY7B2T6_9PSEU|nr:hypothetical protein [Amycolatopsis sp. HUAS 11-8]WAL65108.1 hypothetical protein ORV05_30000 [Amycolatopsis sp. HUAS 11-8]